MAADQERADRIRALKQARPDLTWRRIADHVGVTERSATDWQSKGGIEYANAEKLAELFEVDVDYIWRGPNEAERAPSPFAGQDAIADRLAALEERVSDQLAEHARKVEAFLKRQDNVLKRIEASIEREREAAKETREATRDLLAATDAANRALLAGAERSVEEHGQQAT
jgi:hypothetical protein